MKKILFVLLLPALSFGAAVTWLGTTPSAKVAANWVGGALPASGTDTALFIAANNVPIEFDSTFSLYKIKTEVGYISTVTSFETVTTERVVSLDTVTFAINSGLFILPKTTGSNTWEIDGGTKFNGIGTWQIRAATNGITINIPGITNTGTPSFTINATAGQSATLNFTGNFTWSGDNIHYNTRAGTTLNLNYGSYTYWFRSLRIGTTNETATLNGNLGSSTFNITGNLQVDVTGTTNIISGTNSINLVGTAAQAVTSNGKKFYSLTVLNTGTATIKFADSLTCLGDLSFLDGRDSLGRMNIRGNYTNTSNDSIFQTDTGLVGGNWLRNNAKVSRVGGRWVFNGSANKTFTLSDAGWIGPITIRKTAAATLTAGSAIRAWRIKDTTGALKMLSYALQCTTLTVRDTGVQCAAVTLDTLNSYKGQTTGGGTITRWNWLADGIKHLLASGTTLTVGSIAGLGGTAEVRDTLQGAGAGATLDLTGNQTVTWSNVAIGGMALAAGDTVIVSDGTSVDLGGNTGAWMWPSTSGRRHSTRRSTWVGLIIGP